MALSDNLFWRRLHSFMGFMPLGAYLMFHLYMNSYSLAGPDAYNGHVRPLRELPYLNFIEAGVIFIPLLYHALYGLYVWLTCRSNILRYGYARNWLFTFQRFTGLVALVFIAYHVYDQRFRPEATFANVTGSLENPYVLALYITGVAAVIFHFFNGAWNFFIKWGITVGGASQRALLGACGALGVGLIIIGLRALAGFMR